MKTILTNINKTIYINKVTVRLFVCLRVCHSFQYNLSPFASLNILSVGNSSKEILSESNISKDILSFNNTLKTFCL